MKSVKRTNSSSDSGLKCRVNKGRTCQKQAGIHWGGISSSLEQQRQQPHKLHAQVPFGKAGEAECLSLRRRWEFGSVRNLAGVFRKSSKKTQWPCPRKKPGLADKSADKWPANQLCGLMQPLMQPSAHAVLGADQNGVSSQAGLLGEEVGWAGERVPLFQE